MCITRFVTWLKILYDIISSDFTANCISFFSLLIAVIALLVGGKKVSKALVEYRRKKQTAIFGYHVNMKIFIMRLKRLISNNQSKPIKSLYLFSDEEDIHEKGKGYEKLAEKLADLSQKMLDYLSTESNQIPASAADSDSEKWDSLTEKLINFLSDFLLYNTDLYLPEFDSEEGIVIYHRELIKVLDEMLFLINESKNELKREMES